MNDRNQSADSSNRAARFHGKSFGFGRVAVGPEAGGQLTGFRGHLDPELVRVAEELSLAIVTWDIDTEDWKAPQGLGEEKIAYIEEQFSQMPRKVSFNVLMHVLAGTARDLPSFISRLRGWGFTIAEP